LKLAVLSPAHSLHYEEAIDRLWPELEPSAALNNLHGTLHALRRLLEPDLNRGELSTFLTLRGGLLELHAPGGVSVDFEAFESACRVARQSCQPATYEAALDLYGGDLLPGDRYADWAAGRREALREAFLGLLLELGRLYEQRGDLGAAIRMIERLVAIEPAHEEAHAALMHFYARVGQRRRALRQYQVMASALRRELDAEPDALSRELHRAILSGEFRSNDTAQLGAYLGPDLPRQALTGREHEIATLVARGLTNRQIALRLGLSVRTADTHVCRILRKLGLRYRAQVAACAHTQAEANTGGGRA
jgi:DNA-binding SARP family transcriptional activator